MTGWTATGWRIVGRRGVIQYTRYLPADARAQVFRKEPGWPWQYRIGDETHGRYWTAKRAMAACDAALVVALRSAIAMVRKP